MNEQAIEPFARKLAAEVDDAVKSGDGIHEEEFTRLVLDYLGEEGAVENPIPSGRKVNSAAPSTRSLDTPFRTTRNACY